MFTVVVPTVPGRESLLSRCLWAITTQAPSVPVLVVDGNGRLGTKVNAAAAILDGHMAVIDDDDMVLPGFTEQVTSALEVDPDYVGFRILETENGRFHKVTATRGHGGWHRSDRGPCPKGVTRCSLVRQVQMGNHYTADRDWMTAMSPLVQTDVFIDRPLYHHDWWPSSSTFHGGNPNDVGTWPHLPDHVTVVMVNR